MDIWMRPEDEGGMSHDDGEAMMILFIQQNYKELERFFVERLRRLASTVTTARKRVHRGD